MSRISITISFKGYSKHSEFLPAESDWAESFLEGAISQALSQIFDEIEIESIDVSYNSEKSLIANEDLPVIINTRIVLVHSSNISSQKMNELVKSLEEKISNALLQIFANVAFKDLDIGFIKDTNLSKVIVTNSSSNSETENEGIEYRSFSKPSIKANSQDAGVSKTLVVDSTIFRIYVMEEPLTAHNLTAIISALTSLHTKCWLILQNRFADLIEYTQTHDSRFENEAPLVITKLTHNSPLEMKLNVSLEGIANAFRIIIETVEKIGLTRKRTLAEIEEFEQKITQQEKEVRAKQEYENKKHLIELQNDVIESQNKLMDLRKKQLDFVKDVYALPPKIVKSLRSSLDETIQDMAAPTFNEDILKLVSSEGLKLIEPPNQQDLSSPKE